MNSQASELVLTPSLEDYLETIYQVLRDRRVVRVRDIALARDVKSSSVTPAMKRLADLGLIEYEQREYIDLTDAGEKAARRILSRHRILTRFFEQFLRVEPEIAQQDACAIEHHLSDESMDRLVRFFEFLGSCPEGDPSFMEQFHQCCRIHGNADGCDSSCLDQCEAQGRELQTMSLASLKPGESGIISQVNAGGAIRQRLLDMGVLPDVPIQVERLAPAGDPIWVRLQGYQLSLRRQEAEAVILVPVEGE